MASIDCKLLRVLRKSASEKLAMASHVAYSLKLCVAARRMHKGEAYASVQG